MCGICGEFLFEPRAESVDAAAWTPLIRMMWRRGPDDEGLWRDDRCLLGFRRLTILDLSAAANQPMISPDSRYALVFNGELYNFRELRAQLESRASFRSVGDSEVILHSLIVWGREALARFNGMYALAFYDRVEGRLLLARDHAGMKPLYYAADGGGAIFASQYDQIVKHPRAAGRKFSAEAAAMYLRLGYIPAPAALLEGTHMVEPGCWVSFSSQGHVTQGRYYDFPQRGNPALGPEEASEAIADTLDRVVRRQLVCDVPAGCFLSGGVDSPLIAAAFRKVAAGSVIPAFTIGSSDPDLDESREAGRYADRIGLKLYSEQMTDRDAEALIGEVMAASTEPQADEGMFPSLALSRLAAQHVKVALSGEGGDELFWGYVLRQCAFLKGLETRTPEACWRNYFVWFSEARPREFQACFPDTPWFPSGHPLFDPPSFNGMDPAYSLRSYEMATYLPFLLLKTDRASMHHSLEVRLPFLDREMIEVAGQVRWESCLDRGTLLGKLPLRQILEKRSCAPPLRKRGFTAPMNQWLRGFLKDRMAACIEGLESLAGVRVDPQGLARLWEAHQNGVVNRGTFFWRILALREWIERNLR